VPNAWGGSDPIQSADADTYELGTEFEAQVDITLTHARIWTGPGEINIANRRARVWTTGGAELGIATLPDDLAPGWSVHAYDDPISISAGTNFVASYSTGGNYGFLASALDNNVPSADGNVVAVGFATAVNGNGVFNITPGLFPTGSAGNHPFYGSDVVYEVGSGDETIPVISNVAVSAVGGTATAVVTLANLGDVVDPVYTFDWGDGSTPTIGSSATAQHVYSASGTYALLVTVENQEGESDTAAVIVEIIILSGQRLIFFDVASALVSGISDALVGSLGGVPNRACVVPGAIAWDECDCGQLAVSASRWFLSENFPLETGPGTQSTPCMMPYLVGEFIIQLIRCMPSPQGRDTFVPCAKLSAAARILIEDAFIVLTSTTSILCELRRDDIIVDFTLGEQSTVGPEGGCGGTELRASVAIVRT
jgi:hypothetical protein